MARLLVFLLHGPCPPPPGHGTLSCLSAAHGPHGSGWLLPIDKYQRHPAHIVMSLPLHHHPPPPSTNSDIFSTLLDTILLSLTRPPSSASLTLHPSPFAINNHRRLHDTSCSVPLIPNLAPSLSSWDPFHTSRPNSGLSRTRSLDVRLSRTTKPALEDRLFSSHRLSHFWKPAQEHFLFRPVLRG